MPDVLLVLFYVAVLWLPGGLLAALAGLRGWTLAAMAPLLTYTAAGLAGPWSESLGLRWSLPTFLGWWALFALVAFGVRWFAGRGQPPATPWPWRAQAGVIVCMLAAGAISIFGVVKGLVALSVVAVVRRFSGRAVVAGLSALLVVSTTAFYDNLWRGPLLPFSTGLALTPLAVVLVADLLDTEGARAKLRPGLVFVLGMAGLICVHSSTAFGALLFVLPMLVARWLGDRNRVLPELGTLAIVGVGAGVLASVELLGMLGSGQGVAGVDWPATGTVSQAVGDVLMWGNENAFPQWWLALALVIGLVTFQRLGDLRWLGVAESQRVLAGFVARLPVARLAAAGAVVLVLGVLTSGFYVHRNERQIALNTEGEAVTTAKIEAYEELAHIVPAGERVLNDRGDGSVWMYAIAGVLPVAGHYDATLTGPEANLLANRFNLYDTDPKVRQAVRDLRVGYVILGRGFLREGAERQLGLRGLDQLDLLEKVYQNRDVVIYKIKTISNA